MSILSVDNISPIGSGTSVTINNAATLVLNNVSIAGVTTTTDDINIDADNKKLQIGASQDLQIFHDGGHSRITNTTGILKLTAPAGQSVRVVPPDDSGNVAVFHIDGSTHLYYDSGHKFSTISDGIDVVGNIQMMDSIIHRDDTNTKIRFPANDTISFETSGSERLRIDSSGRFLKGTTGGSSRSSTSVRYPHFQLSSPWSSGLGSYKIECTDDYPIIFLDSNASYANNSGAGVVTWSVKDSSGDYCNTASILSKIDATPSNDSAPGRLEFHTTTSGSTPTTKMTIDSGGSVLKPLNPAFYANNLSNNAVYTAGTVIPWPNTNVDTRSAFATSGSDIGRYTIPTTGIYFFGWRLNRLGDSRFDLAIYVNGSIKYYDELRSDHGSGIWQAESGHYIFNCTAGQKIDLRIASVANAGSGQFDGGQLYDAFFGWMIG